jgi:hypothetical protein
MGKREPCSGVRNGEHTAFAGERIHGEEGAVLYYGVFCWSLQCWLCRKNSKSSTSVLVGCQHLFPNRQVRRVDVLRSLVNY